jgi:hypothetical protein
VGKYAATLDVHRVVAAQEVSERKTVLTLNIGQGTHDQHVSEGLYNAEQRPGLISNRWTGGRVTMTLPTAGQATEVMLRMANGRPWNAPVPEVSVYLTGHLLGTVRVESGFDIYSLPMPQETWQDLDTAELRLEMEPWNPKKAGYNQDGRDLGVLLDWVKIVIEE